jgi:hypothetical protein
LSFSPFPGSKGRAPPSAPRGGGIGHHYDPNQPRVSAGHPDGGQWTADLHDAASSDPFDQDDYRALSDLEGAHTKFADQDNYRVLSDLVPHDFWKLGAQYAQRRTGGRGAPPTGGQLVRLEAARARADAAMRQIQARDPKWEPRPSMYSTIEGQIAAAEGRAQEAETYLRDLVENGMVPRPRPEPIPARGQGRDFSSEERAEGNRSGSEHGCSTCGTRDPGTKWGNFVLDHQPPNAIVNYLRELRDRNELTDREQRTLERGKTILEQGQRLYPQCLQCSSKQGSWLSRWKRR